MMCERCEELQEEIAWLKSELGLLTSTAQHDKLLQYLKALYAAATPSIASMILALRGANGRPMERLQLLDAMPSPGGREDRGYSFVNTQVCHARRALGKAAIRNVWGVGYCLTPAGLAMVDEALA